MQAIQRRAVLSLRGQGSVQQKRQFFNAAYQLAKKVTPKISPTEAAALDAGTVGFDRELFAGNPSLANLKKKYDLKVSVVATVRGANVVISRGIR